MAYIVKLTEVARAELGRLKTYDRGMVLSEIVQMLSVNPTLVSQSRIKLLRQPAPNEYRLRVRDYRVFYDIENNTVWVRRILTKPEAIRYAGDIP